jgi:hypothetical protein
VRRDHQDAAVADEPLQSDQLEVFEAMQNFAGGDAVGHDAGRPLGSRSGLFRGDRDAPADAPPLEHLPPFLMNV